ncbi:hypothetical protein BDV93DRAFT_267199 [Ceratobasidium sp. AG-I]|nr:hypothetical protein BDV93DRAFT_267199 [Ceratobasidium sp. AG-I]
MAKERIEECRGKVIDKLPNVGYALVDQRTDHGVNLIHTRRTPTRIIVSIGFVEASIARGEIITEQELTLFFHEGKPALFHLHESLTEAERGKLHDSIMLGGGNPDAQLSKAQVMIYNHPLPELSKIRQEYTNVSQFGTPVWFESCIAKKKFSLGARTETFEPTARPGRKPGAPRRDFTRQDDECLAVWIALHFGNSQHGRLGNKSYELMTLDPKYKSWSHRHTWQSWRERYKNKRQRIDLWVQNYIGKHGLPPDPEDSDELVIPSFPDNGEEHSRDQSASPYKPGPTGKRKTRDEDTTNSTIDQTRFEYSAPLPRPGPSKRARQKSPSPPPNALKVSASQQAVVVFPSSPSLPPIATLNEEAEPEAVAEPEPEPPQPVIERAASQEETQASVEMESLDFHGLLDPALNTDNAKAILDAQRAELLGYPAAEESDADVDVVGVTQTQSNQLRPMESIEFTNPHAVNNDLRGRSVSMAAGNDSDVTVVPSDPFKEQLEQLASEHGIFVGLVRGYFEQELADDQSEEEALDSTREYVQKLARERRKKKAGKARAGSSRLR